MRKSILAIGLILLVAGGVLIALDETTYGLNTSYGLPADFALSNNQQLYSYNGQQFVMIYNPLEFQANVGDKLVITSTETRDNGGNWATLFIQSAYVNNPTNLLTYNTQAYPIYTVDVGTIILPNDQSGIYYANLGAVQTNTSADPQTLGAYTITVDVYSKGSNLMYLIIAVLFLIAGIVVTIVGLVLKSKAQKLPPPP
jgi:hypothetical protein